MELLKPSMSTSIPLNSTILCVRSIRNLYVSHKMKASWPLSLLSLTYWEALLNFSMPLIKVIPKVNSSSTIISLIFSSCCLSYGKVFHIPSTMVLTNPLKIPSWAFKTSFPYPTTRRRVWRTTYSRPSLLGREPYAIANDTESYMVCHYTISHIDFISIIYPNFTRVR